MFATLAPPPITTKVRPSVWHLDVEPVERILQNALPADLSSQLKHYQGKRLRPMLVLAVAEACGGIGQAHHTLAAAVELVHMATLLHDDVIDHASTRRHQPTINATHGNKPAILAGDMLFTQAFILTSTVDAQACRVIGEASHKVVAGEWKQAMARGNVNRTEAEYLESISGKTAALTECSAFLGACYSGAKAKGVRAMAEYGRCLGIAFQMADDVLDLTGDAHVTGKTLGTDLLERNYTLPVIDAIKANSQLKAELQRDVLDTDKARRMVLDSGAIERTQQRAKDYVKQAQDCLRELPTSSAKDWLYDVAGWATQRRA